MLLMLFLFIYNNPRSSYSWRNIYFWGKTTSKFIKKSLKKEEINNLIDTCAVYWHFLLAVWIVLLD